MPSFKTLKRKGVRYALGSALRKSGHDIEYFSDRRRLKPTPEKVYDINVDDVNIHLDFGDLPISKAIWQRIEGVREPDTTAIIRSLLRPGDKVLELGSCFGYFTLLMSASVGESGRVLGVEGFPKYFRILSRNITRNNATNVDLMNAFIGSKKAFVNFEDGAISPYGGINSYNAEKIIEHDSEKVAVECINIGQILYEKNYHPSHTFMDIEGFEVEAIEQLTSRYLREFNPTLIFEHHEKFYESNKGIEYLKELLSGCDYEVRKVYGNIIAFKKLF